MKTFFRPEQNVSGNLSFSPSAGKPQQFIDYLAKEKLQLNLVQNFAPLTREEMALAHDRKMVDGILDLKLSNGFGNKLGAVADSLPYTSGSFYAAAEEAVRSGKNTCSPTSGFHHAGLSGPEGFCTFNGLMIAAQLLKKKGLVQKVAIVDCDAHYGNGTDDIIEKLKIDWIKHYTFGGDGLRRTRHWLESLEAQMKVWMNVDVIFYQAGADPHIEDPLGGYLTSFEMKQRDELVFKIAKERGIPVVWNLAGGYQQPLEKVLELHKTTYEIALQYSDKE